MHANVSFTHSLTHSLTHSGVDTGMVGMATAQSEPDGILK